MKGRAASFDTDDVATGKARPKSIFDILTTTKVTSDAPKRKSFTTPPVQPETTTSSEPYHDVTEDPDMSSLYSRPLPVYSRMNKTEKTLVVVTLLKHKPPLPPPPMPLVEELFILIQLAKSLLLLLLLLLLPLRDRYLYLLVGTQSHLRTVNRGL